MPESRKNKRSSIGRKREKLPPIGTAARLLHFVRICDPLTPEEAEEMKRVIRQSRRSSTDYRVCPVLTTDHC